MGAQGRGALISPCGVRSWDSAPVSEGRVDRSAGRRRVGKGPLVEQAVFKSRAF